MLESELKSACHQLLEILSNQGKLMFQRNNSFAGKILRQNNSVGWIQNNKKGAPDYYVFFPSGITVHLELKGTKGKQKPDQLVWEQKCEKLKHKYYLVSSLDQLQNIIGLYI